MRRYLLTAWIALLLWPSVAEAAEKRFEELTRSDHFVIIARRLDIKENDPQGIVDRATIDRIAERCKTTLEAVYVQFTRDMGYDPPASRGLSDPRRAFGGKPLGGRTLVILSSFKEERTLGFVRARDRHLRLNLKVLAKYEKWHERVRDPHYVVLIGHELFHAVQFRYDPDEAHWLTEATANWMEYQVSPKGKEYDNEQETFLKHPWLALHRCRWERKKDTDLETGKQRWRLHVVTKNGRPYGTGIFFGFLARHHPAKTDVVRKIWEACRTRKGKNAIAALLAVCGGDAAFRGYFDRFAVGCLLDTKAPEHCRHAGTGASGTLWEGATSHDLRGWKAHYASAFRDPDTARWTVDMAAPLPDFEGPIERLGTRHFALEPLAGIPAGDLELCVGVKAKESEISLQGVAFDGKAWRVFGGAPYVVYRPGPGAYVLRIPDIDRRKKEMFFLITRYGTSGEIGDPVAQEGNGYRVTVAAASPPVVTDVALRQRGKDVHRVVWKGRMGGTRKDLLVARDRRATVAGIPRPAHGDAEVRIVFSVPCDAPEKGPLCSFDGRPVDVSTADGGRTWTGTIEKRLLRAGAPMHRILVNARAKPPGTKAVLPLDQDPSTVAVAGYEAWIGYEQKGKGTEILIRKAKPLGLTVKTTGSHEGAPPLSLRFSVQAKSSADDSITLMWIDPGPGGPHGKEMELGRRHPSAGNFVTFVEPQRSARKEVPANAAAAEMALVHTWWQRGTHTYEVGIQTKSGQQKVKRQNVRVWKAGEGLAMDKKGTAGQPPDARVGDPSKVIDPREGVRTFQIFARSRSGQPITKITFRPAVSTRRHEADGRGWDCAEPVIFRPNTLRANFQLQYRLVHHDEPHGNSYEAILEVEDAAGNTAADKDSYTVMR